MAHFDFTQSHDQPPKQPDMQIFSVPCDLSAAELVQQRRIDDQIRQNYGIDISYDVSESAYMFMAPVAVGDQVRTYLAGQILEVSKKAQWLWLDDISQKFTQYDPSTEADIERAYQAGAPGCNIMIGTTQYVVEFGPNRQPPHAQKNPRMGSEGTRTVRRYIEGAENQPQIIQGTACWKWQEDNKQFNDYTAEANRQIQDGFQTSMTNTLVFGSNNKVYKIVFSGQPVTEQGKTFKPPYQENEKTGYKRQMRCEQYAPN